MIARRGRAASGVFVFLLLGVFAVFAMLLAMLGARAYQTTVEKSEAHAVGRVLENFIVSVVRADDASGAVSVETVNGMDALRVTCSYDGEIYDKWLYCYEGSLRELFAVREYGFDPAEGEEICPAQSMALSREGSLITAELVGTNGECYRAQVALRSAE